MRSLAKHPVHRPSACDGEFLGRNAVVVGHNVRFDLSFLQAALSEEHYACLGHASIDTCALARRLLREEVPDCRLTTLARHFGLGHRPTHRALDDALATGELLHCLLERAGTFGATALDDLVALPAVKGHSRLAKLRLLRRLPRRPGVFLFRNGIGDALYVGTATDLRTEVRSYFSGPGSRMVNQLVREVAVVDHVETADVEQANARATELIGQLGPRFNAGPRRRRRSSRPAQASDAAVAGVRGQRPAG